jgi:hypothetical protein
VIYHAVLDVGSRVDLPPTVPIRWQNKVVGQARTGKTIAGTISVSVNTRELDGKPSGILGVTPQTRPAGNRTILEAIELDRWSGGNRSQRLLEPGMPPRPRVVTDRLNLEPTPRGGRR